MRFKTLMRVAPGDIKNLVAGSCPSLKALQSRHEPLSTFRIYKIHKCVSKTTIGIEINGKVHQIVGTFETMRIKQLQQETAGVAIWNVA